MFWAFYSAYNLLNSVTLCVLLNYVHYNVLPLLCCISIFHFLLCSSFNDPNLFLQGRTHALPQTHKAHLQSEGHFNMKSSTSLCFYLADAVGSVHSKGHSKASYLPTILCSQHHSAELPQRQRLRDSWHHADIRSYSDGSLVLSRQMFDFLLLELFYICWEMPFP